ncbi:hypothetical protein ABAC460_11015 [Asticcacaulis sp. AC460]|uniref:SufD family Fe-S cluster assembly protein n=1 Tax=Asticcacaulis sp. AC460 TaxID=1282360 RepID=UPI0003C3B71B|nr:SufD family Fe-S cluster assembly protein [Asticcacaulis sp. AC460]ESQ89825.1 hypothetical protein ABAC460_11015 [Asticcacaulis sp. AC460]
MTQLMPLDLFDQSSYPNRRVEEWKYSDLSRALREIPQKDKVINVDLVSRFAAQGFAVFTVRNGNYDGLNEALAASNGRLWIRHLDEGVTGPVVGHQGRAVLQVADDQSLTVFETYEGQGAYAAHTELGISLGQNSGFIRIVVLDEPLNALSIRRSTIDTKPGAKVHQAVFSAGAQFSRFETHLNHAGHGAEVTLDGAYLLKGKAHFDLTTRVTHGEVDGVTSQTIRGLVKDQATAVFQGRILVERGADGTDARMRHQALILNDGAHIRAKPELEIYADDVQCAHGNTIGALDEEAMFFCQARGMDEATARGLLTHAFVMPVADAIPDEVLKAAVLDFLEHEAEDYHAV